MAGLAACLASSSLKQFRPLVWMFLTTFFIFLTAKGRFYYVAPAYVMVTAAGSAWWLNWLAGRPAGLRRAATYILYGLVAIGGLAGFLIVKPVAPINSPLWQHTSSLNPEVVEMVGWEDLSAQVAAIYRACCLQKKGPTRSSWLEIMARPGAFDLYSGKYSLPPVISGADGFWYRGDGEAEPKTVIVVGFERSYAGNFFASCNSAGTVANRFGVKNEETTRHTGLYVCRQPWHSWEEMWPDMLWFQ